MGKTVKVDMGAVSKAEPVIETDKEVPAELNGQSVEASVGSDQPLSMAEALDFLEKRDEAEELPTKSVEQTAEISNQVTSAAIGQPLPAIYRLKEDIAECGHHSKGGLENAHIKKDAFCLVREKQGNPADPLLLIESVTGEYKPSGKIAWARLDQLTKIQ